MAVDSPNNKRKAEEQQPEPVDAKRAKEADVETANSPASPSEPVAAAVNTTTVIESAEQFHKIVAEDKFTVAAFFAPWCGGCKTAAPHVAKLAQELTDVVRMHALCFVGLRRCIYQLTRMHDSGCIRHL